MNYYDCPECYADVQVKENDHVVFCPSCKARLVVDRDAEQEEGVWHDLTALRQQEEGK